MIRIIHRKDIPKDKIEKGLNQKIEELQSYLSNPSLDEQAKALLRQEIKDLLGKSK
jgi:hypothetical protein